MMDRLIKTAMLVIARYNDERRRGRAKNHLIEALSAETSEASNWLNRFRFPQRAFRRKAFKVDSDIRYQPSVWHLRDPAYSEDFYTISCCRRGDYETHSIEWKDLSEMEDSDKLCSICFRAILRP